MSRDESSSVLSTTHSKSDPICWIGGVVRVRVYEHGWQSVRVAAWAKPWGSLLAAAIVEGHGPTVLRELFDEALMRAGPDEQPTRLIVSPSAEKPFRELEFLQVQTQTHPFLKMAVEDAADCGTIPGRLRVRVGRRR